MEKKKESSKESSLFGLSSSRSFEEIMHRSSSYVDDYTLGLQFPACDCGCYYLFSPLIGDGPCQAINLGIHVGHTNGSKIEIPQLSGDPNRVFIVTSLICDNKSYRTLDFTTYTRSDVIYSRQGLDLQVADVVRIKGSWPYFEMYYIDKVYNIIYELEGCAGHAHWVSDHIQTNMLYSYLLFPDFKFHGTITFKGISHKIKGIGSFDHVNGRNINNPNGPGVGFWHADPIMWDDKYISNGLFYYDHKGNPYIKSGITTLPDGGYHPSDNFEIEYIELEEGVDYTGKEKVKKVLPRKWRAKMVANHGTLIYETNPIEVFDPESNNKLIEPCIVSHVNGEFHCQNGKVIKLSGKGYNEFVSGAINLSKLN
ncbi:MAG: hypothetical protein FJW61_06015 [Actinobacteria bacterium]|nr:hypothetical protein [Actinomycetota bacterium]